MSNIVPVNIQVPAHLAGRVGVPSVLSAALTGGLSSGNSFPRIRIKASRVRSVEGATETVLEGVTGEFFDDPIPEAIADAVKHVRMRADSYDRSGIRHHAAQWAESRWAPRMRALVEC